MAQGPPLLWEARWLPQKCDGPWRPCSGDACGDQGLAHCWVLGLARAGCGSASGRMRRVKRVKHMAMEGEWTSRGEQTTEYTDVIKMCT